MNIKHQVLIESEPGTGLATSPLSASGLAAPSVPSAHAQAIEQAVRQLLGDNARVLHIRPAGFSERPTAWVLAGRRAAMGSHAPAGW